MKSAHWHLEGSHRLSSGTRCAPGKGPLGGLQGPADGDNIQSGRKQTYNRSTMPPCKRWFIFIEVVLWGTSAFGQSPTCDDSLWQHVYNPSRLLVQKKCVTVTGTIVDATANQKTHRKDGVRHEPDGDTHGWLKLAPDKRSFSIVETKPMRAATSCSRLFAFSR